MEDNAADPFVFCALKKKEEKKFRKSNTDISSFTKKISTVEDLNPSIVVLSEFDELIPLLMNQHVLSVLNSNASDFIRLHITDQELVSKLQ